MDARLLTCFQGGAHLDMACFLCLYLFSNFIPTCSECSTSYSAPGVVSVRGESSMIVCRECHRKISTSSCDQSPFKGVIKLPVDMRYFRLGFKIPEVKFLQVSAVVGTFTVSLDHFQEFAIWGSNAMAMQATSR